jgi:Apea-like HEPN
MNETGAAGVLKALAAGDESRLQDLCEWLSRQENIDGRYLFGDLSDAARRAASSSSDGGLRSLLEDLGGRADSMLVAFFPASRASGGTIELPGAIIGPAGELLSVVSEAAQALWPTDPNTLAILARHPAQGRLGAIRTAAWLQTVLGAVGLAAYARSRTLAPLVLCPAVGTTIYVSSQDGTAHPVDSAAMPSPRGPSTAELADLIADSEAHALLLDATARSPADLAQQRLTLAARWLQLAASAISTADAFVSLGIALETITGDASKSVVVERITKRAAVFLAFAVSPDDREDVFYDELKRAKRLYDLRSRAAHGQYDEWSSDQRTGDADREDFHRFVLDVALGFRTHARERNFRLVEDFDKWWKRAELQGMFV